MATQDSKFPQLSESKPPPKLQSVSHSLPRATVPEATSGVSDAANRPRMATTARIADQVRCKTKNVGSTNRRSFRLHELAGK